MSIYRPIFLEHSCINPQSIDLIIPKRFKTVMVTTNGQDLQLNQKDSAKLLLSLYSNEFLQDQLPDWMSNTINNLSKDEKMEILRQQGHGDDMNPLDLDAESARLCEQLEAEVNNPVEASESELEQTDEDYDVMPF